MAKLPHTRAAMRVFYAFWQVAELAAGYRYTTFKFGDRGGSGTRVTPAASIIEVISL